MEHGMQNGTYAGAGGDELMPGAAGGTGPSQITSANFTCQK